MALDERDLTGVPHPEPTGEPGKPSEKFDINRIMAKPWDERSSFEQGVTATREVARDVIKLTVKWTGYILAAWMILGVILAVATSD